MSPYDPVPDSGWDPVVARVLAEPPMPGVGGYAPALPITYGRFLDPLELRLLGERDAGREVWMLLRPFRYVTPLWPREIEVPAGFVTDGESVPLLLRSGSGNPSTKAGVVHDWLVKVHDPDDEELCARIYRECILTDGVHVVTADSRYQSVAFYGRSAWESGPSRLRVVVVG